MCCSATRQCPTRGIPCQYDMHACLATMQSFFSNFDRDHVSDPYDSIASTFALKNLSFKASRSSFFQILSILFSAFHSNAFRVLIPLCFCPGSQILKVLVIRFSEGLLHYLTNQQQWERRQHWRTYSLSFSYWDQGPLSFTQFEEQGQYLGNAYIKSYMHASSSWLH